MFLCTSREKRDGFLSLLKDVNVSRNVYLLHVEPVQFCKPLLRFKNNGELLFAFQWLVVRFTPRGANELTRFTNEALRLPFVLRCSACPAILDGVHILRGGNARTNARHHT